ncbi:hypothetical protein FNF31_02874 [Cafeteria roenbergensis]|uniref:Metallo-beta-lactamase domain-containing protein n=1 Tax=Cafeteria roenbergensis TaxID=33653 RepID=A0A5A8DPZ2_CAFRO|nr:hypothetical protein FNF31_02874 [Cafeteria roenbergensis]KAA0165930.1 hypothetical protein FNF28_03312 [Cafeteria roenbergensis]
MRAASSRPALPSWAVPLQAAAASPKAKPDHHRPGGVFNNPWSSFRNHTVGDLFKLIGSLGSLLMDSSGPAPTVKPDLKAIHAPATDLQVTWLGHATFLVQLGGINILTDPVFNEWVSPFMRMGPERVTPLTARAADLPPIDVVLVSHNHYDHLDLATMGELQFAARTHKEAGATVEGVANGKRTSRRFTGTTYLSPLGALAAARETGVLPESLINDSLDWWEAVDISMGPEGPVITPAPAVDVPEALPSGELVPGATVEAGAGWTQGKTAGEEGLRVVCVPAQHHTQRFITDHNESLWSGFALESAGRRVYFSGDTGYSAVPKDVEETEEERSDPTRPLGRPFCPAFKQAGAALGPFDFAALPIGAYSPRWFMSSVHADPCDAVRMHKDLGARRSVGMHWGTFRLTDEPLLEPMERLKVAAERAGIADDFTAEPAGTTLALGEAARA